MSLSRQFMKLCLFIVPTGHHEASWRLPGSPLDRLYRCVNGLCVFDPSRP